MANQKIGKRISLYLLAGIFIGMGILHFLFPAPFLRIMPPYMPWHPELVFVSGVFELLFGILMLPRQTRTLAVFGLILLLIAVFPANIYFATGGLAPTTFGKILAWVRLPLQFLLIYWVWTHRVRKTV